MFIKKTRKEVKKVDARERKILEAAQGFLEVLNKKSPFPMIFKEGAIITHTRIRKAKRLVVECDVGDEKEKLGTEFIPIEAVIEALLAKNKN